MIIVTAAIFTSTVIMSVTPTPQSYAQDRCGSGQIRGGSTVTLCGLTHQQAQAFKNQCRQTDAAKCSSSQTGFGEFGNFRKEHGNVPSK